MTKLRIDRARVLRLCNERRVSMRGLANALATSAARMERVLNGDGVETLRLRDINRLGERLGVDGLSLLGTSEVFAGEVGDTPDAWRLHAVLVRVGVSLTRSQLARILGWDMRRVNEAVDALERELQSTGQVLHRVGTHALTLRVRDEALSGAQRARADRVELNRKGLDRRSAALLLELVEHGRTLKPPASKPGSVERAWLVKIGAAIDNSHGEMALHPDARFSLGLDA